MSICLVSAKTILVCNFEYISQRSIISPKMYNIMIMLSQWCNISSHEWPKCCPMHIIYKVLFGWFMVFDATFNNISVKSWLSVLLLEETGISGKNHRPVASHWQTTRYKHPIKTHFWILVELLKYSFTKLVQLFLWSASTKFMFFAPITAGHYLRILKIQNVWIRSRKSKDNTLEPMLKLKTTLWSETNTGLNRIWVRIMIWNVPHEILRRSEIKDHHHMYTLLNLGLYRNNRKCFKIFRTNWKHISA
jgi:hypothetical protein